MISMLLTLSLADPCAVIKEPLKLGNRPAPIVLPAEGMAVTECHYVTTLEGFQPGRWPVHSRDKLPEHLKRSCESLKTFYQLQLSADCKEIYTRPGAGCWTPAESSQIGQAAYGKPLPGLDEMWLGTMYWEPGKRPKPGTKFIARGKEGRAAVLSYGYEHGPRAAKYLTGISPEASWYLGSSLVLGRAKDQSLPLGPIRCIPPSP